MFKHPCILISFLLLYSTVGAQLCSSPVGTCADASPDDEQLIPAPFSYDCMNVSQSSFYSFLTNDNANAVSEVLVSIDGIDCPGSAGADTVMAMVVEYNQGTDPCNPANWSNATDCYSDTLGFQLLVEDVNASSQYFIIVGSNQDPANGACAYSISIAGEPVDIQGSVDPIQISLGESADLFVTGGDLLIGPGGDTLVSYIWSPETYLDDPNIQNPVSTPEQTTTYVVEGTVGGCTVTDLVTVEVGPPIEIFNTFTPNSDGINDTWNMNGIERFPNCKVSLFSRWGQNVFRSTGYTQPWDGTNGGSFLPTGTYYYVIELNSTEVTIPQITGAVTIIH
ncbi:MAG: gliding motility-associated C-terminal domain-containing protein [Flavobacteriales bacterium]|nr:gliding motility-associated C-terminal domain-containing protein [Flavobacteriales bacterium]